MEILLKYWMNFSSFHCFAFFPVEWPTRMSDKTVHHTKYSLRKRYAWPNQILFSFSSDKDRRTDSRIRRKNNPDKSEFTICLASMCSPRQQCWTVLQQYRSTKDVVQEEWNQTQVRVWDRFITARRAVARRAVINRSNTSTSCFDSISDMHTRRAHSQRKLLVLGTCNLTTYKFSFSSYASTCNLLKPEQLQQKIYYTSSRAQADFPGGLPMLLVCTVTSHKCRWIWQLSPKCAPSMLMDFIPVWSAARSPIRLGLW